MPTEEQYKKLIRQLQKEMLHLDDEIACRDKKLTEQAELMKQSISKSEHEKIVAYIIQEYESKLSNIKLQQAQGHNERGAGRKRIASKEVVARVLKLSGQGLSQAKIAARIFDELNIKIKRTTVGEIVRGNYTPLDVE
jgi:hypothetical protein